PEALLAVVGPSALSMDMSFDASSGKIRGGLFHVDMTGTDLRVEDDYFPIATSIMEIGWEPEAGLFTMDEAQLTVGSTTGWVGGVFKLGLDELYGPTVSMSMRGRDVSIGSENGPPEAPFSRMA